MTPDRARVLDYMSGDLTAEEWATRLDCSTRAVLDYCDGLGLPLTGVRSSYRLDTRILERLLGWGDATIGQLAEELAAPISDVSGALERLRSAGLVEDSWTTAIGRAA